jgi:hypothetical protein
LGQYFNSCNEGGNMSSTSTGRQVWQLQELLES